MNETVSKAARNEILTLIARVVMVVSLPLGGYIGSRVINETDKMHETMLEQNIALRDLSIQFKLRVETSIAQLSDHELRIRSLERKQN